MKEQQINGKGINEQKYLNSPERERKKNKPKRQ
jgi:hypothetical protein